MPSPIEDSELVSSPVKSEHDAPPRTPANKNQTYDSEEVREAALRRELEGVRNINEVIEGVISTLNKAKGNMNTVSRTVGNASALLNTWTRILSQTEHNQRLILNPGWKGATDDLQSIEAEALQRQMAAQRRAAEDERRREEARRRAEEAERQKEITSASTTSRGGLRGTRGRVTRGIGRGGVSGSSSTSTSSVYSSRGTSGIGRGIGGTRGTGTRGSTTRGRGVR
ncbi:hypothetical protein MCOR27_004411 [Pyricularia oryzae]|uniref:DASH complex subunit DUO1 n=5 Tax=Pyricularia TaxID=48558 RepID=A0ABQ8NV30_PYRGI|nr:uncharacterized protein MGG_02484 [Pyricularia oryzae 70-15]ELQ35182.1 hypothetical protein OOU_Y34scaffold00725g40 [Pyricularia oryzae Y34]KAH8842561.1 hypothetical protein MCOR01_006466 [Pyricularia oryzae]KAI6302556.1 hypothetical protein MCOR33_002144 [Pyricularia grisea]EHA56668.1 hypothetical protein MGG_02484 [Pyricularia oryzae 70-15]KAH9435810.1 hypothetical protein MCOR02_004729 [Pyricularia oryzae]